MEKLKFKDVIINLNKMFRGLNYKKIIPRWETEKGLKIKNKRQQGQIE